ncbi:hypothetical protein V1503_16745 [Bacillus sp. SCS-151]|uniref:hypothetical protein n=1 Tax=Nanhaiella sioensis TaxID=3115293 RepID=UPI0039792525
MYFHTMSNSIEQCSPSITNKLVIGILIILNRRYIHTHREYVNEYAYKMRRL